MVSSTRKLTEWRWVLSWAPLWVILFFLCSIEEKLQSENKLSDFYKRYVDDTLAAIKDVPTAEAFLVTLKNSHPSISFTMEIPTNGKLPFVGIEICKKGCKLVTSVYRKPTNTGLLLHHSYF